MNFVHLNNAQIDELALMLGDEFPEFIATFIESSENLIASLKQQLKDSNNDDFVISIHSLKGSCRNIGAESLSNDCLIIEDLAKDKTMEAVDPDLQQICYEFEMLKVTLEELARN